MNLDLCAQLEQSLQYQIDLKFTKGIYTIQVKPFGSTGVVVEVFGSNGQHKDSNVNQHVMSAVNGRGYTYIETSKELSLKGPVMNISFKQSTSAPTRVVYNSDDLDEVYQEGFNWFNALLYVVLAALVGVIAYMLY
jgi:hypothetical protein